jgi:Tfp pilus assembly protein PilN
MRPVNLIPPDERRDKLQIRTGPIAYLLVGALALGLAAMTMVVLTNNKIADRKTQIAELNEQKAAVESRVSELQPFIQFKQTEEQRVQAIRRLANGRFDWNRIMHELSIVLPADISLTDLTATAGGSDPTTATSSEPNLQMTGCATGHEAVAGFLAALQDIDGVTGVDLQSSERGDTSEGSASSVSSTGAECGPNVTFQLTVVFGEAPSAAGSTAEATAAPTTSASSAGTPPGADSPAGTPEG